MEAHSDQQCLVYNGIIMAHQVIELFRWQLRFCFACFVKSLKVRKSQNDFSSRHFLQKRTNEFYFTTIKPQVELFSFKFWRKLKTPKNISDHCLLVATPTSPPKWLFFDHFWPLFFWRKLKSPKRHFEIL